MKPTISVVVSAYNEERSIERCLSSVRWADEWIVIDNSSTDKTKSIAKKYGAKVYTRDNLPMLNTNKNFGFSKVTCDWVLNLDADEEIPDELHQEILESISHGEAIAGYWIPRKNILFGKWIEHGLWWPDRQLRLFQRGKGAFPCVHVHEYLSVDGQTASLTVPFLHHNYESISQYIRKMDTIYTENEVQQLQAQGYQFIWSDVIRFPVSDFLKIYFAQSGYKDGLHGLTLALLQAFYSFLVFAKLWERHAFRQQSLSIGDVERELQKAKSEYAYWYQTAKVKDSTSIVSFFWRVKRKLGTLFSS